VYDDCIVVGYCEKHIEALRLFKQAKEKTDYEASNADFPHIVWQEFDLVGKEPSGSQAKGLLEELVNLDKEVILLCVIAFMASSTASLPHDYRNVFRQK
jgi:hypothetical protein